VGRGGQCGGGDHGIRGGLEAGICGRISKRGRGRPIQRAALRERVQGGRGGVGVGGVGVGDIRGVAIRARGLGLCGRRRATDGARGRDMERAPRVVGGDAGACIRGYVMNEHEYNLLRAAADAVAAVFAEKGARITRA